MWNDIKKIKSGRKELREFGIVIGAFLIILATIAIWRGKAAYPYLYAAGIVIAGLGFFLPACLKRPQKIWMAVAIIIGFFMNRLVLSILFYVMITPIGIVMRISGKDILGERLEPGRPSYWEKRSPAAPGKSHYEKQY